MNVVHVFPYTPRVAGGHSHAIRGFLACQRKAGINAVGIAPRGDVAAAEVDWGFPLAEVGSLRDLRWVRIAASFAVSPGDSVIHFHSVDWRQASLTGDLRRVEVPYVFTSHGQLEFQNAWRWLQKFVYLNFVDRGVARAAGLQFLTRSAARRVKLLLPAFGGATLVQGNLVDGPDPNPAVSTVGLRSEYGIPGDAFVVLFLGRLDVRVKALDVVVEAFSRIPQERSRLILAGPDWHGGRTQLEAAAEALGCRARVHFTGPVYGDRKWSLLRTADLFLSPSRWDAFNIALAEAMAVGLPVVTSSRVSLAEELQAAGAALLVEPAPGPLAKAIRTLEADAASRRALGSRGKAWMEHHCSPAHAGPRFREFYDAILRRAKTGRD